MAKSPFYRVVVLETQEDISDKITSLQYERSTEEDDSLVIRLNGMTIEELDGSTYLEGNTVEFIYGYLGGKQSDKKQATIRDVEPSYRSSITLRLNCGDIGNALRRQTGQQVWNGKTGSQIAQEIADAFGLKADITTTTKVHESIPQGNKNYMDLLQYVASLQEGDWTAYVSGTTLHFKKKSMDAESQVTINPVIEEKVSFSPKQNKDEGGASESVSSTSVDPDTLESSTERREPQDQETHLNESVVRYDVNGQRIIEPEVPAEVAGSIVPIGEEDPEEVAARLAQRNADSQQQEMTASLEIEGDPYIKEDGVITITGVSRKHQGNWYIKKVTDKIDSGGYTTSFELTSNATSQSVTQSETDAENVNESIGPEDGDQSTTVTSTFYDANGNPR